MGLKFEGSGDAAEQRVPQTVVKPQRLGSRLDEWYQSTGDSI
jgi:hypothetical protein